MTNEILVVPGLTLIVTKDGKDFAVDTDYSGHFEFDVQPGDYEIVASELPKNKFHVYLKIVSNGANPQYLPLVIDTKTLCKLDPTAPRILKSEAPGYPPAARAVRASGDVSVEVHLSKGGEVSSAKAISGHPLLRTVSETAAKKFQFERSDSEDRYTIVTFQYGDFGILNPKVARFECPNRILITSPPSEINYTTNGKTR